MQWQPVSDLCVYLWFIPWDQDKMNFINNCVTYIITFLLQSQFATNLQILSSHVSHFSGIPQFLGNFAEIGWKFYTKVGQVQITGQQAAQTLFLSDIASVAKEVKFFRQVASKSNTFSMPIHLCLSFNCFFCWS